MSGLAYFLAKDTVDHFNTIVKPIVYLSMFYFFNNPRSTVTDNYVVLTCLVYCVTGIAYALALFLEAGPAQLVSNLQTHKWKFFSSFLLMSQLLTHAVVGASSSCFDLDSNPW